MKSANKPIHRPSRALAAATLALAGLMAPLCQAAPVTLLTDSFDTVGVGYAPFNNGAALAADQTGTLASKDYALSSSGWEGYIQRGNGGQMLLAGYDNPGTPFSGQVFASLNYNFAGDANTLNAPLEIKFNLNVTDSDPGTPILGENWGMIALGAFQNLFVNDNRNKFASLFRDNGETQQFIGTGAVPPASGTTVGDNLFQFTDNDLITLLIADTAGTGSAFNGNGSVAKIYVNGDLKFTSSDLGLSASDGYISFQANGTKAYYDNLVITALTTNTDYDTWANSFTPTIGASELDDDNDGLTNQQEYAFGLNPTSGASCNPIASQLDKATGTFSYTRRQQALGSNLSYSVWFSGNLTNWTEDTGATEGTPVPSGDNETVPVTLSALPGIPLPDKLFIQVRAQ